MKRKSPYEIDPKYSEDASDDDKPDLGKISSTQEIQERKILKIGGNKTVEETKEVKFSLMNNLKQVETAENGGEQKPVTFIKENNNHSTGSSLFDNSKVNQQLNETKQDSNNKPVELSESDKTKVTESIFNIAKGNTEVKTSGLFNNSNNANNNKEEKKGGLFDNVPQSTSGGGLFGNNSSSNTGGLFSNAVSSGSGLFSNTKPSGGLFANSSNSTENKGGLFSGNNSKPAGLFSNLSNNNNQSGGLFGNSSGNNNNTTTGKNNEGDDDGEDDGEVSGQNTPDIDKTVAPKFEYQDIMEKIFEKEIEKIRKNTNEIQEKGFVSIERLKGKPESGSVLVYRNKIKQIVYQGNLVKKLSQYKTINNKPENQQITCVNQEVGEDDKPKYVKDILKIRFMDAKDGEAFQAKAQELIGEC